MSFEIVEDMCMHNIEWKQTRTYFNEICIKCRRKSDLLDALVLTDIHCCPVCTVVLRRVG